MSQSRPKLNNLKRVCPQDLAHCEGYVWHLGTKIGKGSFGEVYLGWTNVWNLLLMVGMLFLAKSFFRMVILKLPWKLSVRNISSRILKLERILNARYVFSNFFVAANMWYKFSTFRLDLNLSLYHNMTALLHSGIEAFHSFGDGVVWLRLGSSSESWAFQRRNCYSFFISAG